MMNQLKTVLLLGTLSALVVGLGALVAPGQLALFGALALAMNLGAYFFSDRLVLADAPGARARPGGGARAARHGGGALGPGRHPEAAGLPHPGGPAQRLRHRPRTRRTGWWRSPRASCGLLDRRASCAASSPTSWRTSGTATSWSPAWPRRPRSPTSAAQALSLGGLFGGDQDGEEGGSPAPGPGPGRRAGGPLRRDPHPAGHLALPRVPGRRDRRPACSGDPRRSPAPCERLAGRRGPGPGRGRAGHGEPLHRQPLRGRWRPSRGWFSTHPPTEERVERLLSMAARSSHRAAGRAGPVLLRQW